MNLICIICSDGIAQSSEVYTTQCGHLFHYPCLIQWIERSKTCPQCRNKATDKTIHRIYLNLANSDSNDGDDIVTLQNKFDNLHFQFTLKEKDVRNLSAKYQKVKIQSTTLREEIVELENKCRVHDSVVHALKDQISFFKSKSKERDKLVGEINILKMKLKQMESADLAIIGSREEVNEMLKNENDIDSLVILVATLKKALIDVEKKKHNIEQKFKNLQNDVTKYRRDISSLEALNNDLRKEVELARISWREEKKTLADLVTDFQQNEDIPNERIMFKRPVLLPTTFSKSTKASPSMEDKVVNILQEDLPYLSVKKQNIVNITPQESLKLSRPNITSKQMSIFKRPAIPFCQGEARKDEDIVYNGLGGQCKNDMYPSPKPYNVGMKRHRTNTCPASTKCRKITSFKTSDL